MPEREREWEEFWKRLALWLGGAILALGGMAVGLWSRALDQRLDNLLEAQRKQWSILSERASLIPRTAELEKRADDQEDRLREVEKQTYRHGHK